MSKKMKIWLIIAASLVLVGGIIFGVMMTILKWDFKQLSTTKYETNNYKIDLIAEMVDWIYERDA